jgi:hypothetical protein
MGRVRSTSSLFSDYPQGGPSSGIGKFQISEAVKSNPEAVPLSEQYETVSGLLRVTAYPG